MRHEDDLGKPSWNAPTATIVASWLCNSEIVRGLVTCPCPARQIRNHLLLVDLALWIMIILAAVLMWNVF